MKLILGLFALGIVVVIVTRFAQAGSSGPNVIKNLFGNTAGYLQSLT